MVDFLCGTVISSGPAAWEQGQSDIHAVPSAHVEAVICRSKKTPDEIVKIDLDVDELDLTALEAKATYSEIKAYVLGHFGLKVSSLFIAQVTRKCGLDVG